MKTITEIQKTFTIRIKEVMQTNNIKNRTEFAKEIDIPYSTVKNWLTYGRAPQIDALYKIAKRFGVSIDYLLGITEI